MAIVVKMCIFTEEENMDVKKEVDEQSSAYTQNQEEVSRNM